MRRALAFGTLVGSFLCAVVALGQGTAPAPSTPPAPTPPAAAPTTPPAAVPSAAPVATGSAAPASPSAAPPAPTAPPPPAAPSAAPPAEPTPPPVTAAPAAAAVSPPVSAGTPSTSGTSPPAEKPVDRGAEAKSEKPPPDPWQDGHALAIEGFLFLNGRLGPSSIEPAQEERLGFGLDLSTWFTLSDVYVLGLGVTRADLGNVTSGTGTDGVDADYSVTAVYLGARAFPYRSRNAEVFLGLRVGMAWQGLTAVGVRTLEPNVAPPTTFACSGSSGPGAALGATVGGALRLGARAWFTGHVDATGYQLTSDVVDNCVAGVGSVTSVSLGAGLLYAFDLGADAKLGSVSPSRAQTW